ncbi:MAG: glycosyltransferase family A protein [Patescibacteria group bacterium]
MAHVKVSIIIPAKNEEKLLGLCLESVTKYTSADDVEIIVVDNESQDRTGEIARSFARVKLIEESKSGVMNARQRGYIESTAPIVAFLDADCVIDADWIPKMIARFDQDPNLAILTGPYFYSDISPWERAIAESGHMIIALLSKITGSVANFGNLAIRRTVLEKMNGLDTSITFYGDDTDTALRASKFGKVAWIRKFKVQSSARRFVQQGIFCTLWQYAKNFISVQLGRKPATAKQIEPR